MVILILIIFYRHDATKKDLDRAIRKKALKEGYHEDRGGTSEGWHQLMHFSELIAAEIKKKSPKKNRDHSEF